MFKTSSTRHVRHLSALAAALLAAAFAAACTTVTPTGLTAGETTTTSSVTQPGGADAGGQQPAGSPSGPGGGGSPSGASGSAGSARPGGGANAGAATGGTTASSCSHPVTIGLSYSTDNAALLAAAGNPALAAQVASNQQQIQDLDQRIADYVNAHGGLAGCKVQLVFHDFASTGADGWSGESQTECADFAEDKHVFAVIPQTEETKTMITCLAQHHTVEVDFGAEYWPVTPDFAQYRGYLYAPDYINPFRTASFIDVWASAGYFGKSPKVGILLADDGTGNDQHVVNDLWVPRLAAMGIKPTVFTFHKVQSYSEVGSTGTQFQSAVLQFKTAGIDHVIFGPDADDAGILFTQEASSQQYSPRYAMSTQNSSMPGWSTTSANQRPGAVGISYLATDLGIAGSTSPAMASNPPTANRTTCERIYSGHTGSSPVTIAYRLCDDFFFLQAALVGAKEVTAQTLLAGAERLGKTLSLANGFGDAILGPNQYDGGNQVRAMVWNEGATRWDYAGPPRSIP